MAVNHYFQGGDGIGSQNEKRLIEDLIVENLKIYGHAVYYLPRTLVNRDLILGEDSASRFDDSYMVEMYFETVEGFQGEQEIISKFGLEIRDDTTFVIAKRRFQEQVDDTANLVVDGRPNEGDVIYYPLMNKFFEVAFVEDQEPFFQLGALPVYKLRCKTFEYSSAFIIGTLTPCSAFPPPTERTNKASEFVNALTFSHSIKTVSHPSSLTLAVNSDILSVAL